VIARSIAVFLLSLVPLDICEATGISNVKINKQREYIKKVEEYFNAIRTFEADFVQIDRHGRGAVGHFFLKRPYLMKMDYRDPPTHVIVAKNNKITHYDRELKEKTETSAYSSSLSFLLEPRVDLEQHLEVLSIQEGNDEFSLKLCKKDEETGEAIILVFSKNPLILKKWILLEDRKNAPEDENTEICLQNHKYGHNISDKEFEKFEVSH
jgi:outer membrane lipoprotein-sorting protein